MLNAEGIPGGEIHLIDIAVEILDLHCITVIIDCGDHEFFCLFSRVVPLSNDGVRFASHRTISRVD